MLSYTCSAQCIHMRRREYGTALVIGQTINQEIDGLTDAVEPGRFRGGNSYVEFGVTCFLPIGV